MQQFIIERRSMVERREHKRFKVKDGSFAVLRSRPAIPDQMNGESMKNGELAGLSTKLAKIIDISGNGLAFYYIESQYHPNELAELDLIFADDAFFLDKILIKRVDDFTIDPKIRLSSFEIRRCGVHFSQLKLNQRTRLGYFLRNYTTNEATVNSCSIPIDNIRLNKSPQLEYHYDLTDRKFSQPTG